MSIDPKKFGLSASLVNAVSEALKGGQVKLDKNHNGKLDSDDFKKLRGETKAKVKPQYDKTRPAFKEEVEQVDEATDSFHVRSVDNNDNEKMHGTHSSLDSAMSAAKKIKGAEVVQTHGKANNNGYHKIKAFHNTSGKKSRPGDEDHIHPKHGLGYGGSHLTKEEVEQIDELSKKTMGSYIKKASHDVATKSAATGRYADRANTVKDQMKKGDYSNYQQGKKDDATADKMFNKSWKRREGIAKATDKLTKETVDEAAVAGNNVVADMDARKTEVQRKIAQKQASFQQSKANKRISGSSMKEAKCTCGEGKGSKMTCETHGGSHGDKKMLKGGKEPILINPPLKEGSNLMHQLRNQLASKTK